MTFTGFLDETQLLKPAIGRGVEMKTNQKMKNQFVEKNLLSAKLSTSDIKREWNITEWAKYFNKY